MSKKIRYSELREYLDIESMNGKTEDVAFFTHFLQDGVNSNHYKNKAQEYYQTINAENQIVNDPAVQYLLPLIWDVAFPIPQNPKFKFIDLFAGIGGFRIAAQSNQGKCVFSSEWDKFAVRTYEKNFGEVPFGDITKIEAKNIPHHDILFAGFPCQPFSYSGKNEGFKDKTRGTLFFDILRILEKKKPKMFLLENVKGLKSHNNGKTLETIINSLSNIGYNLYPEVLKSIDYGLPQMRERWYCVGSLKEIDFKFPEKKEKKVTLENIIEKDVDEEKLKLTKFEIDRINFHFDNVSKDNERVQHDSSKYAQNTKKGKHGVYSYQKKDGSLRFHVGDSAKTQIQEAFYCTLNSYSPTIIANRVPKLWDIQRKLSVLEAQRLQGFPDKFEFPVSNNQAYKQLGNSVSVPVVESIIEKMIKHL